ncbi:hypothetical protein SJ090_13520 [Enterobacter cloacae]|uniref:hypothetical protein n=1 Tax=Enterobacter cloacae TaxID=550 RepID=UPI0029D76037|nr:hypothetical protein [Enterobacter cloacae]MDX7022281.1 hypothetical protein [Enterobacter cloacae]
MKTRAATHPDNRYVPLKTFCERAGIKIRTGRYWVSIGRVRILPKLKPKDHVYVDWFDWVNGK